MPTGISQEILSLITEIKLNAANLADETADLATKFVPEDLTPPWVTVDDDIPGIAIDRILYTFTFNEPVVDFTVDSVTVTNGTKGTFTQIDDTTYTLVVIPIANFEGTVIVDVGPVHDAAGLTSANVTVEQQVNSIPPDVIRPSLVISDDTPGITTGMPVGFTFTFSEPVIGFNIDSIIVTHGTKDTFTQIDATTYTLMVTPEADFLGDMLVTVLADVVTDAAGNTNTQATLIQSVNTVVVVPPVSTNPDNKIVMTNRSGVVVTNYPLQFGRPFMIGEIPNYPEVIVDGTAVATQADVKNRHTDGSVKYAIMSVIVSSLPANVPVTLTFANQPSGNNAPLSTEQMLDAVYDFDATMGLAFTDGANRTASARQMLAADSYTLWTSGQIAQTIELADNSLARAYDIGNTDGFHPFRPRFNVTFWPQLNKVFVRFIGENNLVSELTDLRYTLTLSLGAAAPTNVYSIQLIAGPNGKQHWSMTAWTKTFWMNGPAPEEKIDINHNIQYLAATNYLPNYDPAVVVSEVGITGQYNNWFLTKANDLYDGKWNGLGTLESGMGTTGGRSDLGPYPQWTVVWLYTGDWRMRKMSLTLADLASSWAATLRETLPGRRLNRNDPPGSSTGLGRTISTGDRAKFWTVNVDTMVYQGTPVSDRAIFVHPVVKVYGWSYDGAHQPSFFYPQYILTGDPFYLWMMYYWTTFYAWRTNINRRGPTGKEAGIEDQLRGAGRALKNRVDAYCAAPDSHPEKAFFAVLITDALARWEGGFQLTGTPLDGNPVKTWGAIAGNSYVNSVNFPLGKVPPLHNWESGTPAGYIAVEESQGIYKPGVVGAFTTSWMQHHALEGVARAIELGFPGEAILTWSGEFYYNYVVAGYGRYVFGTGAQGHLPTQTISGAWMTPGEAVDAYTDAWKATGFPPYWALNRDSSDRQLAASPTIAWLVNIGAPQAATLYTWFYTNVYCIANFSLDPRYAIIPRT